MMMTKITAYLLLVVGLATGLLGEKVSITSQPSRSADDLYIDGESSGHYPVDDEDADDFGSGSGSGDFGILIDVIETEARRKNFTFHGPEGLPTFEALPSREPTTTKLSPPRQPTTAEGSQDPPTTVEDSVTSFFIVPDREAEGEEEGNVESIPESGPAGDETPSPTSSTPTSTSSSTEPRDNVPVEGQDPAVYVPETTSEKEVEKEVETEVEKEVETKVEKEAEVREDDEMDHKEGRKFAAEEADKVTSENLWEKTEVLAAVIACGVIGFLFAIFLLLLLVYRMKKKDEGSYDLGENKSPPTAYQKAPTKEFYA